MELTFLVPNLSLGWQTQWDPKKGYDLQLATKATTG